MLPDMTLYKKVPAVVTISTLLHNKQTYEYKR